MTEEPAGSGSGDDDRERRPPNEHEGDPSDESEREGTEEVWSRETSDESEREDAEETWGSETSDASVWDRDEQPAQRGEEPSRVGSDGARSRSTDPTPVGGSGADGAAGRGDGSPFGEVDAEAKAGDDPAEDRPYGPEPSSTPVDPGTIDFEHAVFVLLGALAMVAVLIWIAGLAV